MNHTTVTTIIPTTAEAARADLLWRAIASVLDQAGVRNELIVVVNGQRYDPALLEQIRSDGRFTTIYMEDGNVSLARLQGISRSTGPYFGFLDDDDEYLPGALSIRAAEMETNRTADCVVTNGYIFDGLDEPLVSDNFSRFIRENPAKSLLEQNWFASPASLFRRETVPAEVFDFQFKYFEWTYLFFRLIELEKNFAFLNSITYRKYEDNRFSISKSIQYQEAYPESLTNLYNLGLPRAVRRLIKRKLHSSLNGMANLYLDQKDFKRSVLYHAKCLACGGWRYFPFTRKILFRMIKA